MAPLLPALVALALAAPAPDAAGQAPPASPAAPAIAPPAAPAPPAAASPVAGEPPRSGPVRRYVIERIDVNGVSGTADIEVRRRLFVAPGEVLDGERVLLSRLRLLQLGWFSSVETRVERGTERGLVVVVFDLVPRNTLLVSDLLVGWTPPQGVYGGFGLSQQNFLQRGLGLSGSFVYGGARADRPQDPSLFSLRASFFAPDLPFGRQRLVAGLSALYLHGEEFTCGDPGCDAYDGNYADAPRLRYRRAGGEVTLGFRPGAFDRVMGGFRLESLEAEALPGNGASAGPIPFIRPGSSLLTALTGTYEIDTRDDFFLPRAGVRGIAQIAFASRYLGGDYDYSRYLVQFETAFALFRLPLRLQLAVGAVQGDAPFFDRFYGADFAYFSLGPALGRALELNFSTDSRYDGAVAMGGVEWAIPLWVRSGAFRRGYLSLGVRGVYSTAAPDAGRTAFSRWPVSFDVALRLDTPVGMFNLSAGALVDLVP